MSQPQDLPLSSLEIGDQTYARSFGGPFEVEYALFDAGDIQLHSSGPGSIRELGYRTTAGKALDRLARAGVYRAHAEQAALQIRPQLAVVYARGPAVRRIARQLGPTELFQGGDYDALLRRYAGTWLNLVTLATDLPLLRARAALQALHFAALLSEVSRDTPVFLNTSEYTRDRKAGERTLRRVSLDLVNGLPQAIAELASADLPRALVREGPSAETLISRVTARMTTCVRADVQAELKQLLVALTKPPPPASGPLSRPSVWSVETQLERGDTMNIHARIAAIETSEGKGPATAYLRAHAALLERREEPRRLAEKISAFAADSATFFEFALLAARAWQAAGDDARAQAFAQDLLHNPLVPDAVRTYALEIVDETLPPPARRPPSIRPLLAATEEEGPRTHRSTVPPPSLPLPSLPPESDRAPSTVRGHTDPPPMSVRSLELETRGDRVSIPITAVVSIGTGSDSDGPTSGPRTAPMLPDPPSLPREVVVPAEAPDLERPRSVRAEVLTDSVPPAAADPRPWRQESPRQEHRAAIASPPPRRTEPPKPAAASSPPKRRSNPSIKSPGPRAESAETLSLPPGLHGQPARPFDELPKTILDARVAFTYMSRELGRVYRTQLGVALMADDSGIREMDSYLSRRFGGGERLHEDHVEVRLHGAFLSEVLARTMGGFWVDIAPSEVGYWEMQLPPAVRTWPFGRIMRIATHATEGRSLSDYVAALRGAAGGE